MECHNIEGSIGSLEFQKTHTNVAQGHWVQSSYNADIDLSIETGVSGDHEQAVSEIKSFLQNFTYEGKPLTKEFASEEMINALIAA